MSTASPLRTHLTFQASRFNQTEITPHFINDCCFGEDCAAWLVLLLSEDGFPDLADPWQEDWGWQTSGSRPPRKFLLSFGLIPEVTPEWLISIDESIGLLARLKGAAGPPVAAELAPAIHRALPSDIGIQSIRWHVKDDFKAGRSEGAPTPTG